VEFGHATDEKGHMCFRVDLPLDRAQGSKLAAADGQMGTILRFYRDWKFSGDEDFIQSLYPHVKRAMEFCWIEGGWDADQDGVMEGCQHNTMDVEYFGPNPEISSWYLAALRACEEMGRHMGDTQFADKCRSLHDRGRAWVDQHLFNGEWYEQKIIPITDPNKIAPGIRGGMGSRGLEKPELQVGPGCLIDQLVGQVAAHVCDLGHILDPSHVKTTLRSIRKYNFRTNFWGHFNFLRTYALQDEAGTLMCTYPRGGRPEQPFPYAAEVWTGLEYTAAVGMIQEGLVEDGLKLIEAARSRFDGRRRSPFDEAECGHHYARAMASWAAIPAMSGFGFDAVKQEIRFARAQKPVKWFFSTGDAWGTVRLKPSKSSIKAEITLLGGQLTLRRLVLRHYGACDLVAPAKLTAGKTVACAVEKGTL
jgi:non-lysosomal glucosylceramidase